MSQLQVTTDLTGTLSQTDLNAQDIDSIINEMNRQTSTSLSGTTSNGSTIFYYDDTGRNWGQLGLLPDGSYGFVQVATGEVADIYP